MPKSKRKHSACAILKKTCAWMTSSNSICHKLMLGRYSSLIKKLGHVYAFVEQQCMINAHVKQEFEQV